MYKRQGVIQAGLALDDILLHAGNGLDIEGNARVKLLAQHVDQTLVVSDEALLAALHDQVVGAHQDIQIIWLAGQDVYKRQPLPFADTYNIKKPTGELK